jgi:hypothetical protein
MSGIVFKSGVLVAALSLAMSVAGCANTFGGLLGESLGVPLGSKAIASKVEPNVLVAVDQSSCVVSKERWEKARVGEFYLCAWSKAQ